MNININPNEFHRMKRIDLSNYYRNNAERKIIHCQICKFDISACDVFEHTISQRHKYNKLFIAIVQGRSYNTDIDFIVLNIDRLQCRFCNFLIINSERDDLVISHLQDGTHAMMKQTFLEMIDTSRRRNCLVEPDLLKPVDDSIKSDKEYEQRVNKPAKIIKKKVKIPKKTIPSIEESTDTNNADQHGSLKYSVLSRDYERQRGEKLPEFIAIDKGDTCICTICSIKIQMNTFIVSGHIDGRKHKQNIFLKFQKSALPQSEVRTAIAASKRKNNANNVPEKVIKSKHLTKELKAANNVHKNNVLKCSRSRRDLKVKSPVKLPDYISFRTRSIYECKFCLVEFSFFSSRAIKQHNKGKNHQYKTRESLTFMSEELKLQSNFDGISKKRKNWKIMNKKFKQLPKKKRINEAAFLRTWTKTDMHMTPFQTIPRYEPNTEIYKDGKNNIRKLKIFKQNSSFLSAENSLGHISEINNIHYCEICKKYLTKNSLIMEHVNGKQHQKKMLSSTPGEHINSTERKNQILSRTCCEHVNPRKHKNKIPSSMPGEHVNSTEDKHQILSPTCWEHVNTRKLILSPTPGCSGNPGNEDVNGDELSQIILVDDTWACKNCRVGIRDISLIKDHISSSDHKEKVLEGTEQLYEFESAKKLWVCKLCNKLLHKSTKIIHLNSKHRITNDVGKRKIRR